MPATRCRTVQLEAQPANCGGCADLYYVALFACYHTPVATKEWPADDIKKLYIQISLVVWQSCEYMFDHELTK